MPAHDWSQIDAGVVHDFHQPSLCEVCARMREVISGTGSRFLLCTLAASDKRFAKYPPQPVVRCAGFETKNPPPCEQP